MLDVGREVEEDAQGFDIVLEKRSDIALFRPRKHLGDVVDDGLGGLAFDFGGSMTDGDAQGFCTSFESRGRSGNGAGRLLGAIAALLLYEDAAE
jgi:hypothetical protein